MPKTTMTVGELVVKLVDISAAFQNVNDYRGMPAYVLAAATILPIERVRYDGSNIIIETTEREGSE